MAKKSSEQVSSREVAIGLLVEHMKCSRAQVSGWALTQKIAQAIDDAEDRGARNAESNDLVSRLMAPAEVSKPEKKVASKPVANVSTFANNQVVDGAGG